VAPALVVALLAAVGCDGSDAKVPAPRNKPEPAPGKDPISEEQERYDRERRPDLIVAALGIGPGDRVADVGAGSGLLTVHLARAVAPDGKVVATDIDAAVLDLLGARIQAAGLDHVVERVVVKENDPGLEPGAFDAILLAEVDHYFEDPVAWLAAAAPALEADGRLVITNRIHHRAQSLAAAAKAGLEKVSESSPGPSHFIAVYKRKE
jgi:ubiquinone/menaquinone biosynthesis C-methylase UbiE